MEYFKNEGWNLVQNIDKWHNNQIQFARLLCEIQQNIGFTDTQKANLCMEMDLEWNQIEEIFDRATTEFDKIKGNL